MTNDKLYDNLADDVKDGSSKNRKRAMMLLEECKIREKKNRKIYNYFKIAPKTWALKKKSSQ